jgi:hypothetical protein
LQRIGTVIGISNIGSAAYCFGNGIQLYGQPVIYPVLPVLWTRLAIGRMKLVSLFGIRQGREQNRWLVIGVMVSLGFFCACAKAAESINREAPIIFFM